MSENRGLTSSVHRAAAVSASRLARWIAHAIHTHCRGDIESRAHDVASATVRRIARHCRLASVGCVSVSHNQSTNQMSQSSNQIDSPPISRSLVPRVPIAIQEPRATSSLAHSSDALRLSNAEGQARVSTRATAGDRRRCVGLTSIGDVEVAVGSACRTLELAHSIDTRCSIANLWACHSTSSTVVLLIERNPIQTKPNQTSHESIQCRSSATHSSLSSNQRKREGGSE